MQGDEARDMIKEVSELCMLCLYPGAVGCCGTAAAGMQAVRKLETALQLDDSKPETLGVFETFWGGLRN